MIREPTDIGMQRLTLSDSDKQVRDWFVMTMEGLGCKVQVDAMGSCITDPNIGESYLKYISREYLCCETRKERRTSMYS